MENKSPVAVMGYGLPAPVMCKCGAFVAQPDHLCPFALDVHDDNETMCSCCDRCAGECAADI